MQQSTNVEIAQNIGNIADGSAIGLQIQSMTVMGSFIVRPPKDQTPRPPAEQVVAAYLEHRKKPTIDAELANASEKLAMLRDAFRGQVRKDDDQRTEAGEAGRSIQPSGVAGAAAAESD